jgi:hypothetical protein
MSAPSCWRNEGESWVVAVRLTSHYWIYTFGRHGLLVTILASSRVSVTNISTHAPACLSLRLIKPMLALPLMTYTPMVETSFMPKNSAFMHKLWGSWVSMMLLLIFPGEGV